jgi:hypothetical protein
MRHRARGRPVCSFATTMSMFDCPEPTHTSPTSTSSILMPADGQVRDSALASMRSSFTRHSPSAPALVGFLLSREFDVHFFARGRSAPHRHVDATLEHHVRGEDLGELHLGVQRGGEKEERQEREGRFHEGTQYEGPLYDLPDHDVLSGETSTRGCGSSFAPAPCR